MTISLEAWMTFGQLSCDFEKIGGREAPHSRNHLGQRVEDQIACDGMDIWFGERKDVIERKWKNY